MSIAFTKYCQEVCLPAYLKLKPLMDTLDQSSTRRPAMEVCESFNLDADMCLENIFTMNYAHTIQHVEQCIRIIDVNDRYIAAVNRLFDAICGELNKHNHWFPDSKIDNPIADQINGTT